MKETWTPEQVKSFNELDPSEYMNVVPLSGGKVQSPEPEGLVAVRIIAHKDEQIATLVDLNARIAQQLQDELDEASHRGESRPDLQVLIDECDQVVQLGEVV
jgi:hypothetical protein